MTDSTPAPRTFVSTAIPYVNARPHVGFAMELVLADALARYRRLRGEDVRFVTGTDDNSLKNVRAAEAEGVPTPEFVRRNAKAFEALREPLNLSFDDFIQTSSDPRHAQGVEKLWRACVASGDIYKRPYQGLYCVGCEQFYSEDELIDGLCPEHGTAPELVDEENYFFRLSKYQEAIEQLLESGQLRVVPQSYRNEVLAFVRSGLQDFSVSRSAARARGWGIAVPDDPSQVLYVWFDALGNYITALDYASEGEDFDRYWRTSEQRVHVLGKGITRFHAVYWPGLLLSAGLALPTALAVHGYLTVEGQKIGKSLGNAIEPTDVVGRLGTDVVRYFLCRHVRSGKDGDFSVKRIVAARDAELADGLGNLLRRTVSMIERYYDGVVPAPPSRAAFEELGRSVVADYENAFHEFRHDDALRAAWTLVDHANKYAVEQTPWSLAKRREDPGVESRLAQCLYDLAEALRLASVLVSPFIPAAAAQIHRQLGLAPLEESPWGEATVWGQLPPGERVDPGPPLFAKG